MNRFIVMERTDKNCGGWGGYVRIAVVELEPEFCGEPKMISERARGVRRIVRLWDRVFNGKTERCAAGRAREEAEAQCEQLNCPLTNFIKSVDAA